ncbi:ABC transporter ATP-binding protein [Leptolyngbya sp. FACHB-261]|uniref:ABC transporter ATP-binding protein n=1 Tax=Leptolyngbya sp. FACHB-261 TaxID=2692806 RepID=UPI00168466A6|nr:ABC transporter ATP-binding protein [Leptolyngbya sp. FACHB-261]MBD2103032.1 ABC transporter ATP-binding protein [Leptolyngbya sp. FACHB-261]
MLEVSSSPSPEQLQSCISINGLCKSFAGQVLYEDFDLELPSNQLISIFGPNGCGKSTLINMVSGLMPFDRGQVLINGKPIRRARIGYVFQNYRDSLFPWLSAFENIAYPLKVKGVPERGRRQQVEKMIAAFDIKLDLKRYPYSFSGGQQQLIAILRALVAEPEVLFLDEPFSALDFEMTLFVREKLQQIFMASGVPMVMVVHNLEEAVYLADTILLLSKRPTHLVKKVKFTVPRPRTPETLSSPEFIQVSSHCLEVFRQEMRR